MAKKTTVAPIDNSTNKTLIKAYTDKNGNDYYGFIDPEEMPKVRAVACERAHRFAEMFISESMFRASMAKIIDAGGKGDWPTAISILKEIEYSLEFLGEEQSLLEVAACFFLFEDEDPYELHTVDIQKKTELWKHDKLALDFFLTMGITFSTAYSGKSPEEIRNYLNHPAHQKRKQRLKQLIS